MTDDALPPIFGLPVELRQVERELHTQMVGQHGDLMTPIQKVRMSNLVIYTSTIAQAKEMVAQVPDIVNSHPARVLLLIGNEADQGDKMQCSVLVRCRMLSKTQQACSEQITLYAPGPLIDRLPFAVRSLSIGDLPTNLLWDTPTPPSMGGPLLADLSEHAMQILFDSLDWPEPIKGVAATGTWLEQIERAVPGRWRVASDLNWRRLKYWRRLISQALEPLGNKPGEQIESIEVDHGPSAVVQAWELASWLAGAWAGASPAARSCRMSKWLGAFTMRRVTPRFESAASSPDCHGSNGFESPIASRASKLPWSSRHKATNASSSNSKGRPASRVRSRFRRIRPPN